MAQQDKLAHLYDEQEGFIQFIHQWLDADPDPQAHNGASRIAHVVEFVADVVFHSLLHLTRHEDKKECNTCAQHLSRDTSKLSSEFLRKIEGNEIDWLEEQHSQCNAISASSECQEAPIPLSSNPLIAANDQRQDGPESKQEFFSPSQLQPQLRHVRSPHRGSDKKIPQHLIPAHNPPSIILTRIQDDGYLQGDRDYLHQTWMGWCRDVFGENVPPKFDFENVDRVTPRGSAALEISFFARPKKSLIDEFVDGLRNVDTCRIFVYKPNYGSQQYRKTTPSREFNSSRSNKRVLKLSPGNNHDFDSPRRRPKSFQRHTTGFEDVSPAQPSKLDFYNQPFDSDRNYPRSFPRRFTGYGRSNLSFSRRRDGNSLSLKHNKLYQIESKVNYLLSLFEQIF